jgi:CoA:oxalate CoA-transferase
MFFTITIYPCKDGHIALSASTPVQQELLFALIEKPELAEDLTNASQLDDDALKGAFDEQVMPWFQERTKEEIFHTCSEWRIPCAPVTHPGELLDDPHFRARSFFTEIDHPVAGPLPYPGAPFHLTQTPWKPGRAPLLGEHNQEIYGRLGYANEDLVRLRQGGVI